MDNFTPVSTSVKLPDVIKQELISLRITPKLLGFHYLCWAIETVVADPMNVKHTTTSLYPDIAQIYDTTAYAVERNIRTAIKACWTRGGREKLSKMAGYHLTEPLRATEFISIVATYIERGYSR